MVRGALLRRIRFKFEEFISLNENPFGKALLFPSKGNNAGLRVVPSDGDFGRMFSQVVLGQVYEIGVTVRIRLSA